MLFVAYGMMSRKQIQSDKCYKHQKLFICDHNETANKTNLLETEHHI